MRSTLAALALCALTAAAQAADTFIIDGNHTYPVFEVNHLGFSTQRGRFDKTSGTISLDAAGKAASVEVTIDATSIDMGLAKWDKAMQEESFFNTEQFPTITFKAHDFTFDGDKPVAARGTLTLLGVAKPVDLSISGFTCKPHPLFQRFTCGADLSTTIKRSEFGMTKYLSTVGDEVKILIPVEAVRDW